MPRWPLSGGLGILASLQLAGCGFGDLFRAPGPADGVLFVFQSDTLLDVGDTVPLVVAVIADGQMLPNPRIVIASSDTTRLAVTPAGDAVIGVRQGLADLDVRLVGSIITGEPPDTVQRFRVVPQ
ncbi:MAG: hypothetical protein Q8Q14_02260 [Gemmatimonadales bacterium]|nr:hypothetical protein [Gemmatimonadales bacterium]